MKGDKGGLITLETPSPLRGTPPNRGEICSLIGELPDEIGVRGC